MENDRAVDLRFDTSSLISLFKNQASKKGRDLHKAFIHPNI